MAIASGQPWTTSRGADRRDQRRQARRVPQGPVSEPFHRIADQHAYRNRACGADQHHRERRQPEGRERVDHGEGDHRADHDDFAVREIDKLDDAVDHRVTERHHRIDGAQGEPVDQLLDEDVHARQSLANSAPEAKNKTAPEGAVSSLHRWREAYAPPMLFMNSSKGTVLPAFTTLHTSTAVSLVGIRLTEV